MDELFVCGDCRALAGGAGCAMVNYGVRPRTVERSAGPGFFTRDVPEGRNVRTALADAGQKVHSGKAGYHHTPAYNVFLHDGEWPSAGIELETVARVKTDAAVRAIDDQLWSNWFHFERDGSLDRAHDGRYGYELITEPLPPRAYRDLRLWTGLQNLCTPWLSSFGSEETGLHVHVGLCQFEDIGEIPLPDPADRRAVGKLLSAVVYYCLADSAFVDRVALRKATNYCSTPAEPRFTEPLALVATGRATGAALVDYCVSRLLGDNSCDWQSHASSACSGGSPAWFPDAAVTCGHGTEINQEHAYTVEFRRPKGTMHALSIHRIVELMTLIVRFAGKLCREPDYVATRQSFLDWLAENTTSEALRSLAMQTKG